MARLSLPICAAAAACFSFAVLAQEPIGEVDVGSGAGSILLPRLPPLPNLEAFSSSGASPAGLHTSYGFKWAFADTISEPAWLVTGAFGSGSSPTASSEMGQGLAFDITARLMAGRQETYGRLYVAGFLGPETKARVDLSRKTSVRRLYGLRAEGHLWYRPSDDTVYGWVLSAGTIDPDLWSRIRAGLKAFDLAVVGPEVTIAADPGRAELRLGLFVGEVRLFGRTFEAGFGGMGDTAKRSGWYGTLAHMSRF